MWDRLQGRVYILVRDKVALEKVKGTTERVDFPDVGQAENTRLGSLSERRVVVEVTPGIMRCREQSEKTTGRH